MVNQVRGASKREDVFAATAPHAAMRFILSRAASRGRGRCLGLWDVSVAFFHAAIEEEVQRLVRETLCDGHWKVLTCVPCGAYTMRLRTHW